MPAGKPSAAVPKDLGWQRGQQIELIQSLLGLPNNNGFNRLGGVGQGGNPLDRLQSFFGTLGMPQSGLQRQGADAIGAMLGGPTPEQRALDISMPQLQAMLTGTGPQFERDLSLANQQGGRFGSGNAILRGEALRNLYNLRNQTAGTLGMLSSGAGQANRGLAGQAFGIGQQQAQQGDIETQRRLQLLMQLLGVQQQNVFNVPIQPGFDPIGAIGQIGSLALGFGGMGGGGGNPAMVPGRTASAPNFPTFGGSGLGNFDPFTGLPR